MKTASRSACFLTVIAGIFVGLGGAQETIAKAKSAFKILEGVDNGTRTILEERKAEVTQRVGGKLSGHDWWLWGLTPVDYDGDGDTDLIVTVHGPSHGVILKSLFKETGKLTFVNATKELGVDWQLPSAVGRRTFVWDFNGDGWLDIVGVRSPHLINQGGKKFVPSAKSPLGTFNPQAIVDLNGDGHADFYNSSGQNGLWNPAKQTFDVQAFKDPLEDKLSAPLKKFLAEARGKPKNRFLRLSFVSDHDLDGDGAAEVIMTGYASYGGDAFGYYLRLGNDGRLHDRSEALGLPIEGTPILVRDLDGDGHADVLVAAAASAGFFRNDGTGNYRPQPGPLTDLLRSRDPYLHRADAVDFDRDGLPDLVVSKPRHGPKVIFANLGAGAFAALHKAKAWDSDPVAICDLNDDGLLDVAMGGPGDQVTLYLNATPQPGNYCGLYPRMAAPNLYAVGAKVEVFRAGALGKSGSRPILIEHAHADATPIHICLGKETRFDARLFFPGKKTLDLRDVEARPRLVVTPEGIGKE